MRTTKVVAIGAGSADWGTNNMAAFFRCPDFHGSTLGLVDIDEERLNLVTKLAHRMNEEFGAGMTIESSSNRRDVLPGAEFVIISVSVEREERWKMDLEATLPYGLRQPYAENGGPGGFAHSCRMIPIVLGVAHDMEDLCPKAWMLNYTNPLPRVVRAVQKYSSVKVVGLCPGVYMAQNKVAQALGLDTEDVEVIAAGVNHFGWCVAMTRRSTGEDLYPAFREAMHRDPHGSPLSVALMERVGLFPHPTDDHVCEYLQLCHVEAFQPHEKWHLEPYNFERHAGHRDKLWDTIAKVVRRELPLSTIAGADPMYEYFQERELTMPVLRGIFKNAQVYIPAVNIPNEGYITNLTPGAIVEVPGIVNALGPRGISVGALPTAIAAWCNLSIAVCDLTADAGATGSREAALQALLIDPMINDIDEAEQILDEYLRIHAKWLPQFRAKAAA